MDIQISNDQKPAATDRPNRWTRFASFFRRSEDPKTRRWQYLAVFLVILIIAGTVFWSYRRQLKNTTGATDTGGDNGLTVEAAPTTVNSVLDGLPYDSALASRRPLAVMIENHPDARPQFGLTQASIVYEAIAEGGITRFMGIFGPAEATQVGPIRSARTYYIDWAEEYNAVYIHAGGAANALAKLSSTKSIDQIDQIAAPYMWRQQRGNVASEHTLFGNTVKLREYAAAQGWSMTLDTTSWSYAADTRLDAERAAAATAASTNTITIPFSTASYLVKYTYDPAKNVWKRDLAGKPHIDALNNLQIAPANVVIQVMNRTEITSGGKQIGDLTLYGSGPAWVAKGGLVVKGTWKKEGEGKRTRFYDENGQEISLLPGQTWVEVIQPTITPTFN